MGFRTSLGGNPGVDGAVALQLVPKEVHDARLDEGKPCRES